MPTGNAAATAPQSFVISGTAPGAPTIGTATAGNTQATVTFSAPGSNGGSTITGYTATSNPGGLTGTCTAPCTSINVTGLTNGTSYTFTVTATNSAGPGTPSAASNSVIPKANQTISFGAAPTPTYSPGGTFSVSATATSGLAVAYTTQTSGICTVDLSSGLVTIVTGGSCTIAANQAGSSIFNAAPQVTQLVNIAAAPQTVTFAPASPVTFGVTPITLTATASSGLTAFTFSTSSAASICTVATNQLTIVGVGTCVLTASQAGNANVASASANANVVINQASQTVTFAPASPVTFGVTPITLTATASSGLTAFTFSTSSAASICTVATNQLTIVGVGTCVLTASQAGNANVASASANANVVINQASQTVTFAPASPVTFGVTPITLTATASSGLTAFTFSTSSAASICTVATNQLTIVGVGTCVLTASQAGNANVASASANANVVINQASQTVTFAPASPVTFGVTPITLTATASSGLTAFTFSTSSAASICTVATNQLTIVGVGTCVLTASQGRQCQRRQRLGQRQCGDQSGQSDGDLRPGLAGDLRRHADHADRDRLQRPDRVHL
ncbi:MAG: fibronectin type III domain-containing protein [Betaproteobacteria bacterium]|nr:fibronectin type III domain-containing protein [Betaproteobacteria bacterium]